MNSDEVVFRAATPADVERLVPLINRAYAAGVVRNRLPEFRFGQRTNAERLTALIDAEDSILLFASLDDRPIAGCHLERHGDGAYFGLLSVDPDIQGGGHGRAMVAQAEAVASARWGSTLMDIHVMENDTDLKAWYERFGYRLTGEDKTITDGHGHEAHLFGMSKALA